MGSDLWQSGSPIPWLKAKARVLRGRREALRACPLRGVPGWLDLGLLQLYVVGWGKYARFLKI